MRTHVTRLQTMALAAGMVCLLLCGAGAFLDRKDFFISYLFGYLFWLGLALGCFVVAMLHHLTGGRWGFVIRRFLEAAFHTLPILAVLFIPVLFGLHQLYAWTDPGAVAADKIMQSRRLYMNPVAYTARTILFFGVWIWLAYALLQCSFRQDATTDPEPTRRLRKLSGPGIVVYALTATLAYTDWVMSLEPDWHSTLFAVLVIVGQMLAALAFMIILLAVFRRDEPLAGILTQTHFHHLSNLLLAFVMLWTYMSFSQLLIIWSGNLPHEIEWYVHRSAGSWRWIILLLALFHFFIPFFLLLFRDVKQRLPFLVAIAVTVFVMHIVDVYWMVAPSFYHTGVRFTWLNVAAVAGIGGIWFGVFAFHLKRAPFLPVNDPRMPHALSLARHAH